MEKVKAGLRGLSASDKVSLGNAVLDSMSGNPYFPHPTPSLIDMEHVTKALQQACVDALDRGRMACARKRSAVTRFDRTFSALAAYVNSVCMGDSIMLYSSGFPVAKRPEPLTDLKVPEALSFERTQFPGVLQVRWDSVPGAVMYEVESQVGQVGNEWQRIAQTTRLTARIMHDRNSPPAGYRIKAIGTKAITYSAVKVPAAI
jgi:hypothetical protein